MKKLIYNIRKLQLKRKDFTIFSNNCIAGFIYQKYNLPYLSPTVGMQFKPCDFIKFCKNYKDYLAMELEQTENCDNKWFSSIGGCHNINFPLGKLGDLTIYFQHSKTFEDAKKDWDRRKARIVEDNLFFILYDMTPNIETAKEFETIENPRKIYLYHKNEDINTKSSLKIKGLENSTIAWWSRMNKFNPFSKTYYEQFDYTKWLNKYN